MSAAAGATFYARRLGWHVLPCWWIADGACACSAAPGTCKPGKHPLGRLVPHGVKDASADPSVIRSWWQREPRANLAVATGPGSDLLVLDVDGSEGERALVDLERRYGPLPDLYTQQWTGGGRGGWQALFTWPEGRQIGNSAGKLGPKLDTRGSAGYVVVPPSVTTEAYRWAEDRDPVTIPPEPAPAWLIDLLDPPAAPEPERAPFSSAAHRPAGVDAYSLKAFETELKLTARAPEGERNAQLFSSAFSLLRLVESGRLTLHGVVDG